MQLCVSVLFTVFSEQSEWWVLSCLSGFTRKRRTDGAQGGDGGDWYNRNEGNQGIFCVCACMRMYWMKWLFCVVSSVKFLSGISNYSHSSIRANVPSICFQSYIIIINIWSVFCSTWLTLFPFSFTLFTHLNSIWISEPVKYVGNNSEVLKHARFFIAIVIILN